MSDIVERLRSVSWTPSLDHHPLPSLIAEAADRIEQLEAENVKFKEKVSYLKRLDAERDDITKANALLHSLISNREARIEQLEAALETIALRPKGMVYSAGFAPDDAEAMQNMARAALALTPDC